MEYAAQRFAIASLKESFNNGDVGWIQSHLQQISQGDLKLLMVKFVSVMNANSRQRPIDGLFFS